MNIFNNKKESIKRAIPENHISKKKKNTYTVIFSNFAPTNLFELCTETPLGLATKNGKHMATDNGWIKCKHFPNPVAQEMEKQQPAFREALGKKISTTIIEYLDKDTNEPVLQVYPTTVYVFDKYEDNFMTRLNHASRRDFIRQIELRAKMLKQAKQNQL